ncbi:hypothetical protein E6C72_31320 (plasmid) [Azospirillum sp. TSH100]|nr:hypothetical protein E6C72_31320 [Azospirillum sp. TSH100]
MGDLTIQPAGNDPPSSAALPLTRIQERLLDAFLAGRSPRTQAAYQRDVQDFAAFVGVADPEEAARRLIATAHGDANGLALAYRAHMVTRKLAPATINRRLSALRSLVQLANVLGLVGWQLDVDNVRAELYRDTPRSRPGRRQGNDQRRHQQGRHEGPAGRRDSCGCCMTWGCAAAKWSDWTWRISTSSPARSPCWARAGPRRSW